MLQCRGISSAHFPQCPSTACGLSLGHCPQPFKTSLYLRENPGGVGGWVRTRNCSLPSPVANLIKNWFKQKPQFPRGLSLEILNPVSELSRPCSARAKLGAAPPRCWRKYLPSVLPPCSHPHLARWGLQQAGRIRAEDWSGACVGGMMGHPAPWLFIHETVSTASTPACHTQHHSVALSNGTENWPHVWCKRKSQQFWPCACERGNTPQVMCKCQPCTNI